MQLALKPSFFNGKKLSSAELTMLSSPSQCVSCDLSCAVC
jgi:hypothetical protein